MYLYYNYIYRIVLLVLVPASVVMTRSCQWQNGISVYTEFENLKRPDRTEDNRLLSVLQFFEIKIYRPVLHEQNGQKKKFPDRFPLVFTIGTQKPTTI